MNTDIIVIAEHLGGTVSDNVFELLGKARSLANGTGGQVLAILAGNSLQSMAGQLGAADVVLTVEDEALTEYTPEAYNAVIAPIVMERKPRIILVASTSMGLDTGTLLSAGLHFPVVTCCTDLTLEDEQLVFTSQLYGGKMMLETASSAETVIAQILPGAFPREEGISENAPEIEQLPFTLQVEELRMRFVEYIEPEAGDIDITQYPVLVSVGRGIQSADNIELAEEVAEVLGGAVSSSRPVVDQDWLPITRQVGKSGMIVKPKLYLALGISGAPEHIEGMKDAEMIVGINTDVNAPIFTVAHYGIEGDVLEILPELAEKLRERMS